MKKLATSILMCLLFGIVVNISAEEKKWSVSLPGYNIGTTYSYYQPSYASFKASELDWLNLDPVSTHKTVWSPGFAVRYSLTPNLQVGLHFNSQLDQWRQTASSSLSGTTTLNTTTVASLTSYLPTAVIVYRIPVGEGHFSLGGGVGYYVVNYKGGKDTVTVETNGASNTSTFGQVFAADVSAGAVGAQIFTEFSYPVLRDIFFISIRAGYVFCSVPQPFSLVTNQGSYYLPDIELIGLLGTIGFTAEF